MPDTSTTMLQALDIHTTSRVEVLIDRAAGGKPTLWVNVDGICRLRCTMGEWRQLTVDDHSPETV